MRITDPADSGITEGVNMSQDLIFGYTWEEIQRAQNGGRLQKTICTPVSNDPAIKSDLALLEKHGIDGLKSMQFFGVIDRLQRAGMIAA